jgi:hypothetical protein
MRSARHGELVGVPAELVEPSRLQEGHDLERLGARSRVRDERCLARSADQGVAAVDDRGMHTVPRFSEASAAHPDVELEHPHAQT